MKRLFTLLLALCLCAASALAEKDPSAVDLSGVTEVSGRLSGVIALPGGELSIDCELPAAFTPEQAVRMQVSRHSLQESELSEALSTLGLSIAANEPAVSLSIGWAMTHESPRNAASEVLTALLSALEVQPALLVSCPGLDGSPSAAALYSLHGLPVMDWYPINDPDDLPCSEASMAVLSLTPDGKAAATLALGLPLCVKEEPASVPSRTWQELLAGLNENGMAAGNYLVDTRGELDEHGLEVPVPYATSGCITAILPCYVSRQRGMLEPGYCVVTEERLDADGSLVQTWVRWCAADDLAPVT